MAETYKELRELPDDELMKRYSEGVARRDTPVICTYLTGGIREVKQTRLSG